MNQNEFTSIVTDLVGQEYFPSTERGHRGGTLGPRKTISVKWATGGVEGGSCWDSSNPREYVNSDPEPAFTELHTVLEKVCPAITYLQYCDMTSLIERDTHTVYEYYGNCTHYATKSIRIGKLYQWLVAKKLINV